MTNMNSKKYFEFISRLGYTKHYGSMAATRALADICQIRKEKYVLDVGCGVGATPVFLAREFGCHVMGVDLIEGMVVQARHRARAAGLEKLVEFKAADARKLPFEDDTFDVVLSESVNIFFEDKVRVIQEYMRVTRPGGFVGTTEMTWLQPPSAKIEEVFKGTVNALALDADGWIDTLKTAGLRHVIGNAHQIDLKLETKGRAERYGRWGIAKVLFKTLAMILTDRQARYFMRRGTGAASRDMLDIVGYGVYVGQKEA